MKNTRQCTGETHVAHAYGMQRVYPTKPKKQMKSTDLMYPVDVAGETDEMGVTDVIDVVDVAHETDLTDLMTNDTNK